MRCRLPTQKNAPGALDPGLDPRGRQLAKLQPGREDPRQKMLEECGGSERIRGPNRVHEARGAHPGR